MVISFTEKEKKYLEPSKGDWKIKSDCPERLRKRIEEKIKLIAKVSRYGNRR